MKPMVFSGFLGVLTGMGGAEGALAQEAERIPSHCRSLVQAQPPERLWKASVGAPLPKDTVRLHFIGHAMFALEAGDVSVVTDYNGFIGETLWSPDVVTMNQAHTSHYTNNVHGDVAHILEGWGAFGEGVRHDLDLGAMRIRNVPTDIRLGDGREPNGNSIFIFEAGGLCIGHLGHLHHEPTEEQYAAIGRLDVVMAPVDGGYTVPRATMVRIVERFRSSIIIPMHWFSRYGLDDFLTQMEDEFPVVETQGAELLVSLDRLPGQPTIMVLEPEWLSD
ncbi:L-ascorbate metabolism protein UlaG, beta-lactamase superfamily [Celeribacter neptunius]|uniref:L-ascorbate metabolism protein UlaG, beta-lactamase superfamily n=2 Tax=Celeribacter neptunius TaxID=588602 RepID=A0A1I3TP81_9RHOB|nr:L-ascorbate metabolism protein UlaG, beta-lactamase superfamily [Celeribacter neptunius]